MTVRVPAAVLLCGALLHTTGCTGAAEEDKIDPAAMSQDESDRTDP